MMVKAAGPNSIGTSVRKDIWGDIQGSAWATILDDTQSAVRISVRINVEINVAVGVGTNVKTSVWVIIRNQLWRMDRIWTGIRVSVLNGVRDSLSQRK